MLFGVKMTEMEWKFLEHMRGKRLGYCEDQIDCKWQKTLKNKLDREAVLKKNETKCC